MKPSGPIPRAQWAILALLLIAAALFDVLRNPFNADPSWYLTAAGRLLDGGVLYRDVIDMNLPIVYLAHLPAAWLARLLAVRDTYVFAILVALAALAAGAALNRVCRIASPADADGRRFAVFSFVVVGLVVPVTDYGQREQLFFLSLIPLIALAVARDSGATVPPLLAATLGVVAGAGFALKPYFLLALLPVLILRYRRARMAVLLEPEIVAITAVQALQVAWIVAAVPQYLEIARYTSRLYGALNVSTAELLTHRLSIVSFLVAGLVLLRRPTGVYGSMARLAALCSMACWLAAMIQRKGFGYHYYPALATALLSAAWMALDWSRSTADSNARLRRVSAVVVFLSALWVSVILVARTDSTPFVEMVRRDAAGKPVLVLSSNLLAAFPLINESGARWTLPYNCLWMLPGLYAGQRAGEPARYHPRDRMDAVERAVMDAVASDVESERPALIIVDAGTRKFGFGNLRFDFVEYFSADPRFRMALEHYQRAGTLGRFVVLRRDPD